MSASALASVKLPTDLVDAARAEAQLFQRSISGQVEHWAKLGRAVEATPGMTLDRVRAALAGQVDPGELEEGEFALFDDLLDQRMTLPTADALAFRARLRRTPGKVGYDESGRLVRTLPGGGVETIG